MTDQSCKCGRDRDRCICFSRPSLDAPPAINRPSATALSRARDIIDAAARNRAGFLKDTEVAVIAADPSTRLQLLLVRCGSGRFIAPAQDARHFIEIIESDDRDYVRDVSIYSSNRELTR